MSTIHAEPTKNFFIEMITRDIDLNDCIYDLIDNSLDGAAKELTRLKSDDDSLEGFFAKIEISKDKFRIIDNCGGISSEQAINYAFHFGRPTNAPEIESESIGLYGIGMKRAIFKIGKLAQIESETTKEAWKVEIDVNEWAKSDKWEFNLSSRKTRNSSGTSIEVSKIPSQISESFSDDKFINGLHNSIAKYYALFIERGFGIYINKKKVKAFNYVFEVSDQIVPSNFEYVDKPTNINVQIIAGLATIPPDDATAESKQRNPENWGWYVVCNDRVVLAADKSTETIWGRDGFTRWHPQYNGFMGIIKFSSKNTKDLPWTTTKREIDQSTGVYLRALSKMKDATRPIVNYTSDRKENRASAKEFEIKTSPMPVNKLAPSKATMVPKIEREKIKLSRISYEKPSDIVEAVAEALGKKKMPKRDIGIKTFDYYVENEIGDI